MKLTSALFTLVILGMLVLVTAASAQVPPMMNYQGQLTDDTGTPVADEPHTVTFRIYDQSSTERWVESHTVTTAEGLFSVQLGSNGSPLTDDVLNYDECWLGITVGGDPELTPRTRLIAVPYAVRVGTVDGATGGNITGKVSIGTGHTNTGPGAFVAGENNTASGAYATIGGGLDHNAGGWPAGRTTIGGGQANTASGEGATIAGGVQNEAGGPASAISGGSSNTASGQFSAIGGGGHNSARGSYAVVCGGGGGGLMEVDSNAALGDYTTVGGGSRNIVDGDYSSIAGGEANLIQGDYSFTVGYANTVAGTGDYSTLFGIESDLSADSTFMVDMPHVRIGNETTGYELPTEDGTVDQVIATNGAGQLSWTDMTGPGGAGIVPVGSIVAWAKSLAGVPQVLPDNFEECDGQIVSDPGSPLNGAGIPDLNGVGGDQRYLKGSTTSGSIGGAATHNHKWFERTHSSFDESGGPRDMNWGGKGTAGGDPNIWYTEDQYSDLYTNSQPQDPNYYEVVWIIRTK